MLVNALTSMKVATYHDDSQDMDGQSRLRVLSGYNYLSKQS